MSFWRKLVSAAAKWGDAGHARFERRRARKQLRAMDRRDQPEHEMDWFLGKMDDGGASPPPPRPGQKMLEIAHALEDAQYGCGEIPNDLKPEGNS